MTGPFASCEAQTLYCCKQCLKLVSAFLDSWFGEGTSRAFERVVGGYSSVEDNTPLLTEDQDGGPLDAPGVQSVIDTPGPSPGPGISQPEQPHPPSTVLVMRHAHRADEDDETWTMTASRPWDPPLSSLGREQAREAAQNLRGLQPSLQIDYVITSPFLRCLQTSAEVVKALNLPPGRWLVDWSMGEIAEPRLLLSGRPELEQQVEGRPIEAWMWGGSSAMSALHKWAQSESSISGIPPEPPLLLSRPPPPYPEARESAMGRYQEEVTLLAKGLRGTLQGNCLVVTHGEAVRCAVNTMSPDVTVYEVKHCAYVQLSRPSSMAATDAPSDRGSTGGRGGATESLSQCGWRLVTKSGETGVSWFA